MLAGSQFRDRLLRQEAGSRLFEHVGERLSEGGSLKKRGVQRADSTPVLAAVRRLNQVEFLDDMLRAALKSLTEHAPEWLTGWVPPEWFERSGRRIEEWRLPQTSSKQQEVMEHIGQDGFRLLDERWKPHTSDELRALPEVSGVYKTW